MRIIKLLLAIFFVSILICSTSISSTIELDHLNSKNQFSVNNNLQNLILGRFFPIFNNFLKRIRLLPFPEIPLVIGERPILLILVEFSNVPHWPLHNHEYFDDLLFGDYPSVCDYYNEVSYGKFNFIKADILGWYKSNCLLKEGTTRDEIAREAIKQAANDKSFNFSSYDKNGNQILTVEELNIVVCTSGISDTKPKGAYHNWWLKGRTIKTWDGMYLSGDHSVVQEWHDWMVTAHELGHSFNLTDLYDYRKKSQGIGVYGLMGLGNLDGTNGNHLSAWSKIKLGWIEPKIVTKDGFYIINDSETNPEAYIIMDPSHSKKEYFLIENRFRGDSYDNGTIPLPDQGIIIYHIDENVPKWWKPWVWFPMVNNIEKHKMIDVECADSYSSHYNDADDLDKNNNSGDENDLWDINAYGFNSTSVPCDSKWYDGSSNNIGIYVLSEPEKEMLVYLSVNGTTPWGDWNS